MAHAQAERFIPGTIGPETAFEHLHRYELSALLARGKRVLDLASGEGYGAARMAEFAAQVTGVELDPTTAKRAQTKYWRDNLTFVQGSITALPRLGQFDVITCFEAIEHVHEHDALLQGILTNLAPDGIALISTPDKAQYSILPNHHNPFHVSEMFFKEFQQLLATYFNQVAFYGQRVYSGSHMRIVGESDILQTGQHRDFFVSQDKHDVYVPDRSDTALVPLYYMAVCSRTSLPRLPGSTDLLNLSDSHMLPYRRHISHLEQRVHDLDAALQKANTHTIMESARLHKYISKQQEQINSQQQHVEQLRSQLDIARREYVRIALREPVRTYLRVRRVIDRLVRVVRG